MSTTTDHGDFVFQCDAAGCRETLDTATSNFEAARNLLRRAGWVSRRIKGSVWTHRCRECARAGA